MREMKELISSAVSDVWNNKWAYGLTTGASFVRWALTAGVIDLAADSAGVPAGWRAAIATSVAAVTVSVFSPNHLIATKKIVNGASGPDGARFSELTLPE